MKDATFDLVDVSHTVEEGITTYPGLPAPAIGDYLGREQSRAHYAPGTEFHIGRIDMVANTGTYVDAPFHRFPGGVDLSELSLRKLANLEGLVVRIPVESQPAIDAPHLHDLSLTGRAVLIHTGWSKYWKTEQYFDGHPFLTEDAALYLRDNGALMVGIDSLNIDDTSDGRRPAHSILLQAEIPIVEHLTRLDRLPDDGFRFFAVPVKVKDLGSFPVRAFGLVPAVPLTSYET
ncbi:MAG: cyclase family protein [Chloroflexota bacterium]|nr:MAG: cyclase family protein [Chloroflexota bacterium]